MSLDHPRIPVTLKRALCATLAMLCIAIMSVVAVLPPVVRFEWHGKDASMRQSLLRHVALNPMQCSIQTSREFGPGGSPGFEHKATWSRERVMPRFPVAGLGVKSSRVLGATNVYFRDPSSEHSLLQIPLWPVSLILILFPVVWIVLQLQPSRQERRVQAGLCPTCGYDLRATVDRCPECGTHVI